MKIVRSRFYSDPFTGEMEICDFTYKGNLKSKKTGINRIVAAMRNLRYMPEKESFRLRSRMRDRNGLSKQAIGGMIAQELEKKMDFFQFTNDFKKQVYESIIEEKGTCEVCNPNIRKGCVSRIEKKNLKLL